MDGALLSNRRWSGCSRPPGWTVATRRSSSSRSSRRLLPPTALVTRARAHGLLIHTWTFRNERRRLAFDYAGNPLDEYLQLYRLGVDGVFSEFPDAAAAARVLFLLEHNPAFAACFTKTQGRPEKCFE